VGLCCLDSVCYVEKYPEEDSDTRVFDHQTTLGGNACNSCVVLAQLDPTGFELFTSLPSDNPILNSLLAERRINIRRLERPAASIPISTCIINQTSGSRTILHYRGDLPELTAAEFAVEFPDLDRYSWIHFEGRNFDETKRMIEYCRARRAAHGNVIPPTTNQLRISLELEKVRPFPWYAELVVLADVLFVSKDFAKSLGFKEMESAVPGLRSQFGLTDTTVIVPWGERGVAAQMNESAPLIFLPAVPPAKVVDTLAAGDCFIAAALHFLNAGLPLAACMEKAAHIASRKCGQKGLVGLDLAGI